MNATRSLRVTLASSAFLEHWNNASCSARRFSAAARNSGATVFGSTSFWALAPCHSAGAGMRPSCKTQAINKLRTAAPTENVMVSNLVFGKDHLNDSGSTGSATWQSSHGIIGCGWHQLTRCRGRLPNNFVSLRRPKSYDAPVWRLRCPHHLCRASVKRTSEPKPH